MISTAEYTTALDRLEAMIPSSGISRTLLIGAGVLIGGFVLLKVLR